METLQRQLRNQSRVTLFTTSCYAGGWIVHPHFNQEKSNDELISWTLGERIVRASGNLAATALLHCLVNTEENEQSIDSTDHPAYTQDKQLANSVYGWMKELGLFGNKQSICFSAQDDEWEINYQPRLGPPLALYRRKWQSLRRIPSSHTPACGKKLARKGGHKLNRLQYLANEYLAAQPSIDNLASNVGLHSNLKFGLRNATLSNDKVDELLETTAYRLGAMHEAEYLRSQVGISFPSIFDVGIELVDRKKEFPSPFYAQTRALLLSRRILTTPVGIRRFFPKPLDYLTVALVSNFSTWDEIQEKVDLMSSKKKAWYRFIFKAWRGNKVAQDHGVRKSLQAYREALKKFRE
ncbi:hypothetical protein N7492_005112 [Penicillium capsulatum]|uniref:Uncharacterized protein n=1 Tax=Penicillium capsulatum TaxID=69766 RepID=A0A9W9IB20_9EURO|nr:hypothetical protein N7492_005112 [Penicillium capsulatum]